MAAQPLANPLDDSAQYLSRPVPATNDAIDSSLPQSAVPSILVSPASPMAPSLGTPRLGPEAGGGRKVEPERGEEEEVRVGRDEAGENGQQGQARNWRNWAGKSPARQTAKLPPTSSSSSSPPAANRHPSSPPASSSRPPRISPSSPPSSFPSSSSTASNARQPPSEARTFFASLASSIPSVSLPSFSLSSLLPSRLPGAPHFEIQEGGFSSDEEEEEDEDDLEDGERRKELGGQKEGKQKEVLMRQSMDLRIEDGESGAFALRHFFFPLSWFVRGLLGESSGLWKCSTDGMHRRKGAGVASISSGTLKKRLRFRRVRGLSRIG